MKELLRNLPVVLLAATSIGICGNVSAQVKVSQRDRAAIIQAKLAQNAPATDAKKQRAVSITNNKIGVLLTIDENTSISDLEAQGLTVNGRIGNYIYGEAIIDNVDAIAGQKGVKAFSVERKLRLRNDESRKFGGLDKVQAGEEVTKAYTGEGVIAGIFDTGLDPNHITFNDELGHTRVRRLWNFNSNGRASTYTDATMSKFTTDDNQESHGTHVLGTIAGSCTTTKKGYDLHGVAPGADLAVACGDMTDACLLSGVQKIIDYAASVDKPVAINMSLGDNIGPHDGTDTFTAALNELAKDTPIFVASGNEGADGIAIISEFTEDATTLKTIIAANSYTQSYYGDYGATSRSQGVGEIDVWSDDDTPVKVYLDIIQTTNPNAPVYTMELTDTENYIGRGTVYQYFLSEKPATSTEFDTYYTKGFMGGYTEVCETNNRYHAAISVFLEPKTSTSSSTKVSVRVEGEAGHKVYCYTDAYGAKFNKNGLSGFTAGSGNGSISNMGSGKNTISIGAYVSRSSSGTTVGDICDYSSWGELVDGRTLPEVIAPGSVIYSAMNSQMSSYVINYYYTTIDTTVSDGSTYYWTSMEGTSMATPYATGVGVLLLEANPYLTPDDIRNILRETADATDEPNGGAGKINVLEAIKLAEQSATSVGNVIATPARDITIASSGSNVWSIFAPNEDAVKVTVNAMSGASVKRLAANGEATLDLSTLTPGIYVINVAGAKSTKSLKVVVK